MEHASATGTPGRGAALADRLQRQLFWAGLGANGVGALLAFGFLAFVLPIGPDPSTDEGTKLAIVNSTTFVLYMAFSFTAGTRLGRRAGDPIDRWLRAGRAADERERRCVLRLPLEQALISFALWEIAGLLFAAVNVGFAVELAVVAPVGATLGGAATGAMVYLIVERIVRPATALALAGGVPERPLALGIRGRLTVAWVLGTAVALLGLLAVAVAGLLSENFDRISVSAAALFLGLLALAAGFAMTRLAARSVADPLTEVRSALARVEKGDFDVQVPVDDGSEIGFLEAGFNRMATGLQERERLREAFGTFVDPNLTERVLQEGTDLAGEEVEVSVLFMDVRDFTGLAERKDAQQVVAMLNDLYEAVVPVIVEHGGHANKFIGDGLLAVFGAPRRLEDHAGRAVQAALEIARLVNDRFGGDLRIGVGVNSGSVVAGTIGGGGRLDFTVIGDVVNTAARVEAATRETGDDVLITEATLEPLSGGREGWEERPRVELKGKREHVRLYAPAEPRPVAPVRPTSARRAGTVRP